MNAGFGHGRQASLVFSIDIGVGTPNLRIFRGDYCSKLRMNGIKRYGTFGVGLIGFIEAHG